MVYQTESKLQSWRAVAVFADGTECLVYLGRSTTQVRAGYAAAYAELLDDEEHRSVREVGYSIGPNGPRFSGVGSGPVFTSTCLYSCDCRIAPKPANVVQVF
jgi:hypothetical protein